MNVHLSLLNAQCRSLQVDITLGIYRCALADLITNHVLPENMQCGLRTTSNERKREREQWGARDIEISLLLNGYDRHTRDHYISILLHLDLSTAGLDRIFYLSGE